ncbi:MAG: type I-E CRISPR-associated protein Cas7/Cse4/CasC [Bacillota bacterium]
MLIEIHMLQNHAPSNLNRDDSGSPKDCIFGGIRRSRISSQCLKRSIRKSVLFGNNEELKNYFGEKTRSLPSLIREYLKSNPGEMAQELIDQIGRALTNITKKAGKDKNDSDDSDDHEENEGIQNNAGPEETEQLLTPQMVFFTHGEIRAIGEQLKNAYQEDKDLFKLVISFLDPQSKLKNTEAEKAKKKLPWLFNFIKKAFNPMTVDVALFGRMTTSNAFLDVQAAMQVAHAISTHKMDHEFDYFTAIGDLTKDQESIGAEMIGDTEFNSACYYKYFSLDYNGFINNLAGPIPEEKADQSEWDAYRQRKTEACRVAALAVPAFLKAAIFTTPSGKQNSFAAHQLPEAILIEIRPQNIPVSYANAFVKPAKAHGEVDLVEDSLQKFVNHVDLLTKKYSLTAVKRLWFSLRQVQIPDTIECQVLEELITELNKVIESGEVNHD